MRLLISLALLLTVAAHSAAAVEHLVNGGFEGEYAGGVAPGWRDNSYSSKGPIAVRYTRETANVRSGEACQKIVCDRMGYLTPERSAHAYHAAWQMVAVENLPLVKGGRYRVRAAVRAESPVAVELVLRMRAEPWTTYVSRIIVADKEWREVDFIFISHVTDPQTAFFVRSEYLGTVWVDDVSAQELTAEELAALTPPALPGNLLQNGDFSLGRANWSGERSWTGLQDASFTSEEQDGNPCLKAVIAAGLARVVVSDSVRVTPRRPLRVSCRVRAAVRTKVTLAALYQSTVHNTPAYCSATAEAGPEWQTLTAAGEVGSPIGEPHAWVALTFVGPGPVWVDDFVLRQDESDAPVPRIRAAIAPDRYPLGLYHDGETVRLRLSCAAGEQAPPPLKWRLSDYRGGTVREEIWQPGKGIAVEQLALADLPRGYYHAAITWQQDGREQRNESTFCVLPPAERPGKAADSFFGGHFGISPVSRKPVQAVGVRWIRLWPPTFTLWSTVEPERGKWHWPDAEVNSLVEQGFAVLGMLESPPAWAKWGDATRWADWENYVEKTVEHFRDRIHVWEVDNEPNLKWWWIEKPEGGFRAKEHLDVLKHTYPVVKRVDPTATVYGGCIGGDFTAKSDWLAFTEELIAQGGLAYMDVLSFHYYHSYLLRKPLDERPDPFDQSVARIRARMKAAGRELPIVNSEGGTFNPASVITNRAHAPDSYDPLPGDEVARLTVRQHVIQWAAGLQRFFFYNHTINGVPVGKPWDAFVEGDSQPRPVVAAYATMTWLLEGATFERSEHPSDDVWLHHFKTPRGPLTVAWSRTGTEVEQQFAGARQAWDMVGKEMAVREGRVRLTADPVYVLGGQ